MIETCYEDTAQAITFWILAETFYIPFTFYNFNNQLMEMEILISQCTNERTQTTINTTLTTTFWILSKNINAYDL